MIFRNMGISRRVLYTVFIFSFFSICCAVAGALLIDRLYMAYYQELGGEFMELQNNVSKFRAITEYPSSIAPLADNPGAIAPSNERVKALRTLVDKLDTSLARLNPFTTDSSGAIAASSSGLYHDYKMVFVGIAIFFIAFGAAAGIWMARSVSLPLLELAAKSQRAASGELDLRFANGREDELGLIAASMDKMLAAVRISRGESELMSREALKSAEVSESALLHTKNAWLAIEAILKVVSKKVAVAADLKKNHGGIASVERELVDEIKELCATNAGGSKVINAEQSEALDKVVQKDGCKTAIIDDLRLMTQRLIKVGREMDDSVIKIHHSAQKSAQDDGCGNADMANHVVQALRSAESLSNIAQSMVTVADHITNEALNPVKGRDGNEPSAVEQQDTRMAIESAKIMRQSASAIADLADQAKGLASLASDLGSNKKRILIQ